MQVSSMCIFVKTNSLETTTPILLGYDSIRIQSHLQNDNPGFSSVNIPLSAIDFVGVKGGLASPLATPQGSCPPDDHS